MRGRRRASTCRSPPDPGRAKRDGPPALAGRGILSETAQAVARAGARTPEADAHGCRKYSAELAGSFVFFGIGYLSVAAFAEREPARAPNLLVVPWSFGFGLLAAIFAFGHISGGHFNPAVTVAMVLDRRTTPIDAVGYIASQVIGALAAGALVTVAVSQAAVKAGITAPGHGHQRHRRPGDRDLGDGRVHRGDPRLDQARPVARRPGDPALARRDPLRHRHAERRVGQPGPLDRVRRHRRRHVQALDLHRGADRRRGPRLGAWKLIDGGAETSGRAAGAEAACG